MFSYIVFGLLIMLLFLCSALYHSIPTHKSFLKKMDHCSTFFLILGTYTPKKLIKDIREVNLMLSKY
ncbi:hemolysin III family protein [Rummeliibacillus sp. SL167]|uniref:hemolysin III family protein n=1 Tax=Rummeliibacillus sp. SL167 TaxID=2579792 RepID=UPI0011B3ACE4